MRVLLAPEEEQVRLKGNDFCTAQPGGLLSIYGEPCHEGLAEISQHGCGRVFLGLEGVGGLSTVGVVAELANQEVRSRLEGAVFVRKALLDLHEDAANPSKEAEGAQGMLAGFRSVVMDDLREMGVTLAKVPEGSVFGVSNTGSGSRLSYRAWGRKSGSGYDEGQVDEGQVKEQS